MACNEHLVEKLRDLIGQFLKAAVREGSIDWETHFGVFGHNHSEDITVSVFDYLDLVPIE